MPPCGCTQAELLLAPAACPDGLVKESKHAMAKFRIVTGIADPVWGQTQWGPLAPGVITMREARSGGRR